MQTRLFLTSGGCLVLGSVNLLQVGPFYIQVFYILFGYTSAIILSHSRPIFAQTGYLTVGNVDRFYNVLY